MKILCDTDILSSLAKVNRLDLLERAFPNSEFVISDRIYDELFKSKENGFDFPDRIFNICKVISMSEEEIKTYEKKRDDVKYFPLSNADLESLIIARENNYPLLSNDYALLQKSTEESILALDIYDLFRILYVNDTISEEKINHILDEIEEADFTVFKERDRIFE
ncbi:MAG: hypothetical protein ABEK36_06080 [Candidatus Aenigmatarchaeota archaeon]